MRLKDLLKQKKSGKEAEYIPQCNAKAQFVTKQCNNEGKTNKQTSYSQSIFIG